MREFFNFTNEAFRPFDSHFCKRRGRRNFFDLDFFDNDFHNNRNRMIPEPFDLIRSWQRRV